VSPPDSPASDEALLEVKDLVVDYRTRHEIIRAVSGVSFSISRGETLGLVGESGCGKSTTGRSVTLVQRPTSGSVVFAGTELTTLAPSRLRQERTKMQMVFQDPISSLNPRRRILDIVAEPLNIWQIGSPEDRLEKAAQMLEAVGMDPGESGHRRPQEFSGGQCQRISIARALILRPLLLVCDEPVSALDVSVQAQILNLLHDLKHEYSLTMLFIAHDLAVVKNASDRVAVMYLGRICEVAPSELLYEEPQHPYSAALLASIPDPDPRSLRDGAPLTGDLPSPADPPSGCRFRTRCPHAQPLCEQVEPPLEEIAPGHLVACHFPEATRHA
jgi:peptide/nickel transport system ATP-binding protein